MNKKYLSLYGLKWNPFSPELPVEALYKAPRVEHFCWRVENQLREGGFALVTGDPGTGKSAALRILAERFAGLADVTVGELTRPQSASLDFYREMGSLFGVKVSVNNRWDSAKSLREKWQAHIESTLMRPILIIDEAQDSRSVVLNELRFLASKDFDSRALLTVVLCGDGRLPAKFRTDDLLPVASRIRTRLNMEYASQDELTACLRHLLETAGNAKLLTAELVTTLVEHAAGNYRVLTTMADELLQAGAQREAKQLDEKLYFEVFAPPPEKVRLKAAGKSR